MAPEAEGPPRPGGAEPTADVTAAAAGLGPQAQSWAALRARRAQLVRAHVKALALAAKVERLRAAQALQLLV